MTDKEKWALNELRIIINEMKEKGEYDDYSIAPYKTGYKLFKTLLNDTLCVDSKQKRNSIDLLLNLSKGMPLTPIKDESDVWKLVYDSNGNNNLNNRITRAFYSDEVYSSLFGDIDKVYICKRYTNLHKKVYKDGKIVFSDCSRVVDLEYPEQTDPLYTGYNGLVLRIMDQMYPITMPYIPRSFKRFKAYTNRLDINVLTIVMIDDYDSLWLQHRIGRSFKFSEDTQKWTEIIDNYDYKELKGEEK